MPRSYLRSRRWWWSNWSISQPQAIVATFLPQGITVLPKISRSTTHVLCCDLWEEGEVEPLPHFAEEVLWVQLGDRFTVQQSPFLPPSMKGRSFASSPYLGVDERGCSSFRAESSSSVCSLQLWRASGIRNFERLRESRGNARNSRKPSKFNRITGRPTRKGVEYAACFAAIRTGRISSANAATRICRADAENFDWSIFN